MGEGGGAARTRVAAGAAFIVVATFIAYIPAIRAGFIWDDDVHVTDNVLLRSAEGLKLIWTRLGATPQYYPLTHTSFWVEYGIWGDRPFGYHVTNVALHVLSSLLLWRILHLLGLRAAWLAACLFAVHPVNVESVAWVTERKNVLSGAFYFGAMLAYLRASFNETGAALRGFRSGAAWSGYLLALVLFVCAVLSKTVAGTLPAALLLIIWWKTVAIPWRHVLLLLPMFCIGIVFGSITGWMERTQVGAVGPEWEFTWVERCLIAGRAVWHYVYKLVLPVNLTFIYPRWDIDARETWQYLFPLGVIAAVVALFALRNRIGRGPLVAVLYFIGTLFPALGFVNVYPMRFSFVADHFQYLAGVGMIVLIAEGLARVWRGRGWRLVIIPLVLAVLTWRQAQMYHDARTLWETTLARNPEAWIAHDHLGAITGDESHYARAIELNPHHVEAYTGWGNLLLARGDVSDAVEKFRAGTLARPDKPAPYYGLGVALAAAGDVGAAIDAHERALAIDPKFIGSRVRLIELYTSMGRGDDAARHRDAARRQLENLPQLPR
jgi:tetratricopeptide (TPR) repeat protein